MKDIETREDLETLLAEFYKIATIDGEIGHHFAALNLRTHLPMIVNFWEKFFSANRFILAIRLPFIRFCTKNRP